MPIELYAPEILKPGPLRDAVESLKRQAEMKKARKKASKKDQRSLIVGWSPRGPYQTQEPRKARKKKALVVHKPRVRYVTHAQLNTLSRTFLTREKLTPLRDELEHLMNQYVKRSEAIQYKIEHLIEDKDSATKREVRDIKHVLGLDMATPRYATALQQPVTWSYFHVWISRINDRLAHLEQAISKKRKS
jgi:hypothetical protein